MTSQITPTVHSTCGFQLLINLYRVLGEGYVAIKKQWWKRQGIIQRKKAGKNRQRQRKNTREESKRFIYLRRKGQSRKGETINGIRQETTKALRV